MAPRRTCRARWRAAEWLTDFLLDAGGLRATVPAAVSLAEDSRRWFEQRITEEVTVARASHAFGVSARWLQRCFIERWGQAPMEFVAARRLARTRARLTDSDRATVVEEVARQSGFSHPGRFAVLYRRVYGESPSQTVARARYRPRPPK